MALNFTPEIWSAMMLESLKKNLVYGDPSVVNRDYEGEISAQGDTVHIRSISRPTISNYTKGATLTYETLTDADRTLLIDQAKSFSFVVDDIDKAQQPGGALEGALTEATYSLRDVADQYIAGLYTGAASANARQDRRKQGFPARGDLAPSRPELGRRARHGRAQEQQRHPGYR